MTNETILRKAIKKAVKNGWVLDLNRYFTEFDGSIRDYYTVIFSHEFCKAYWGTESIYKGKWKIYEWWQKHLQIMVLKEEPLKYLEKFL